MEQDSNKQIKNFYEFGIEYLTCDYEVQAKQQVQVFDTQQIQHDTEVALKRDISDRKGLGLFGFLQNPVVLVFHQLDNIVSYLAGKFVFETDDKDFAAQLSEIGFDLIKGWYFGSIYVVYSESIKEKEKQAGENYYGVAAGRSWWEPRNFPRCNIRIFVREQDGKFRSVLSNVSGIDIKDEELVYFSAAETRYFGQALKISLNYLEGLTGYHTVCKASVKRLICDIKDMLAYQSELDSVYETGSPIVERKATIGEENFYQEMILFPVEEVNTFMKNILLGFDECAKGLGIQGRNLGEKKERVTVGENEVDTDFISSIQMFLLQRLKAPFHYLKKVSQGVPEDLEVAIYVKKVTNEIQEQRNEEVRTEKEEDISNKGNE